MIGPQKFIHKAKHFRKLFGAGMRQVGVLSAAARIALEETFNKLEHTHILANWLANELQRSGAKITYPVDTNMVSNKVLLRLDEKLILPFPLIRSGLIRLRWELPLRILSKEELHFPILIS